ncbi:hypothetical protein FAZ15_01300 [Sphingobacterium olei]|uniref:Uncharacterized protein n=1 Tax=Sphingobacterium olei TaxID=2571155 RepID=A0A4U0PJ92_9SPHI|nr:hypothetical protein [Sphingobacterium olei]TJZ62964.1 hypothetical protein FAZ15_01300 [Sphingobacterium olei]
MKTSIKKICILLFSPLFFVNCTIGQETGSTAIEEKEPIEVVKERIQAFLEKDYSELGELLYEFEFKVKTDNLEDYEDGYIPWASLSDPKRDLPNLHNKNEIIIKYPQIKVMIDYPVTNIYEFNLKSKKGFTRAQLLSEISKHYHLMYEEEEKTATIKTIPPAERTKMYNRNETNGRYGLWGHDISDMDISGAMIYKNDKNEIIIVPFIES